MWLTDQSHEGEREGRRGGERNAPLFGRACLSLKRERAPSHVAVIFLQRVKRGGGKNWCTCAVRPNAINQTMAEILAALDAIYRFRYPLLRHPLFKPHLSSFLLALRTFFLRMHARSKGLIYHFCTLTYCLSCSFVTWFVPCSSEATDESRRAGSEFCENVKVN